MKRILVVAVAAILARCGFTFFSNHAGAEAHDAEHGHEQEHEEGDFDNIPLSQKQVDAVDLKMGEAVDRVMDATIAANGQLVLRAQNKGDVASLMGGVVKAIYVKEGQNVKRGQGGGAGRKYRCGQSATRIFFCQQGVRTGTYRPGATETAEQGRSWRQEECAAGS